MMKWIVSLLISMCLVIGGCKSMPPGHDPDGPGNSENAPGHNKHKHQDKHDKHDH